MGQDEAIRKTVAKMMPSFRKMILGHVQRLKELGQPATIVIVLKGYEDDLQRRRVEMREYWASEGDDPDLREAAWKEFIRRMRKESGN